MVKQGASVAPASGVARPSKDEILVFARPADVPSVALPPLLILTSLNIYFSILQQALSVLKEQVDSGAALLTNEEVRFAANNVLR